MTLYRQLLIFTLILFVVLFVGVWIEKLQSTRTFLVNQLESHAQDTATSLGLSLSPAMAENDFSTIDTMLNAVFDRGYYRVIRLEDVFGEVISDRVLEINIDEVPTWFINMIPLETPRAEALIMSGWSQAGKLFVESHPGYAYRTLWQAVVQISIYFGVAGVFVLTLGGFALKLLLKPLKRVEQQAEAICRKEYTVQEVLPKTRELRQVVVSMNRMTSRVKEMFVEQAKTAERLRKNAYSDQLTGLGNRRFLTGQVESKLAADEEAKSGALFMLQVEGLQKINEKDGFAAGDSLLKKVATVIQQQTKEISNVTLARLTGGDFAMFFADISIAEADEIATKLCDNVKKLAADNVSYSDNLAHIGGVVYDKAPKLGQLLSEADNSLHAAHQLGPNKWVINSLASSKDDAIKGKTWWKETLDDVLEKGDIILYGQPVVSSKDRQDVLHQELLSRIVLKSGEIVSAGIFVPLAERLNMISLLDKVVLGQILQQNSALGIHKSIAVNISPSSLNDSEFVDWLLGSLNNLTGKIPHIIFELPEFGAVQYLDAVKDFSTKAQALGHAIGLDHFGQSFSNFGYLKSLRPEYVKIDRAFTNELESDQGDSCFFIGALAGVAHSLDIHVIAEGVEKEEQVELLLDLNIDALQGYLFGAPKQMSEET